MLFSQKTFGYVKNLQEKHAKFLYKSKHEPGILAGFSCIELIFICSQSFSIVKAGIESILQQ